MSDRIVLLNGGRIEQEGAPDQLYFHPRTLFAADFLGDSNLLDGTLLANGEAVTVRTDLGTSISAAEAVETRVGARVKVMVRPENVRFADAADATATATAGNRLDGEVLDHIILGGVVKSYVRLPDGRKMVVQQLTHARRPVLPPGSPATLYWSPEDTLVLPVA